ncbi:MAG: acylneuraminate cytidylyltransferase family protein [Maribacter sp.]
MKVVALLPMKGNSERVPNKNLKDFCGRPLYHRILNTLLDSKYISEIVVNTDGPRIKEDLTNNYQGKVTIHDRPDEIIGDFVSMNKIIGYDIDKVDADLYIQTHSTNPLLQSKTLDEAIERMLNNNGEYDSMFSVTKVQTRLYDEKGNPSNHNPQELIRTQDLPPLFEENSSFYIFTRQSFKESGGKRIGAKAQMFEMDKVEAIDIDQIQDFIIAESLYKLLR